LTTQSPRALMDNCSATSDNNVTSFGLGSRIVGPLPQRPDRPSGHRSHLPPAHLGIGPLGLAGRRPRFRIHPDRSEDRQDVLTRLPSMTTGQIAAITPANWISPANRPSQIAA
jgi:hypothetical protein